MHCANHTPPYAQAASGSITSKHVHAALTWLLALPAACASHHRLVRQEAYLTLHTHRRCVAAAAATLLLLNILFRQINIQQGLWRHLQQQVAAIVRGDVTHKPFTILHGMHHTR
jgi:Mg2+/citrate symporter